MGRIHPSHVPALIALSLLAGCVTGAETPVASFVAAPDAIATPQPARISFAQARKLVIAERKRLFKDPESVRDAKIGQPYACPGGYGTDCICIEANAKNSYGGYTGVKLSGIRFPTADTLEPIGEMGPYATCGKLVPIPELNGKAG